MTDSSKFAIREIPKYDGFHDHWFMLLKNLLCSKEYWGLIEHGVAIAIALADATLE